MRKLLIVSNNEHKVEEFRHLMHVNRIKRQVVSLKDIDFLADIEEYGATLEENAMIKVDALKSVWQEDILADDSGFEINALNGEPGVFSARYAGEHGNHAANIAEVLYKMEDKLDRKAQFRCVLAGRWKDKFFSINGVVEGHVLRDVQGWGGFGYDPIFTPHQSSRSFAQMSLEDKSLLSHRGIAFQKWISWIRRFEV
jgi:XTP/dITP diphosphohydrolase